MARRGRPGEAARPRDAWLTSARVRVRPGAARPPQRIVYAARPALPKLQDRIGGLAEVVDGGDPPRLAQILADLCRRGVSRLLVEGGARLGTQFLAGGLVDELQLADRPVLRRRRGGTAVRRAGQYPAGPARPMHLAEVRPVGEVVLLRYLRPAAPAGPGGPDRAPGPGPTAEAAARG